MDIGSIDSFLTYWQKIHGRTRRLLDFLPAEHIEWTYAPGKWTVGDLVRHLAALERWMFVENAFGRPSLYDGCGRDLADGYEPVIEFFVRSNEQTVELLGSLPDSRLLERCTTPGGASLPVWKWLRAMVEHHCHHRGQIYLYLAQLGVSTPPLYGLTAEQVEERGGEQRTSQKGAAPGRE